MIKKDQFKKINLKKVFTYLAISFFSISAIIFIFNLKQFLAPLSCFFISLCFFNVGYFLLTGNDLSLERWIRTVSKNMKIAFGIGFVIIGIYWLVFFIYLLIS